MSTNLLVALPLYHLKHERCTYPTFCCAVWFTTTSIQIKERTEEILRMTGGKAHVMNLGHGIEAKTPEPNAKCFVDTVKSFVHEA